MKDIKTHSKEIAESFLSNRSKKQTAKAFGISEYGVDSALYYQGFEEFVSPSVLAIKKREVKGASSEEGLTLGQRVKRGRNELGLTLQQLGEKCGVGGKHISRIEQGLRSPSADLQERLTKVLKLDLGKPEYPQGRKVGYLTGKQVAERGLELASARRWANEYWETNPNATPRETQKALKAATGEFVASSTIGGWLKRWKAGKAIAPGTATEETTLSAIEETTPITPADIADALLSRVVNYLHDYDSLLEDRAHLKEKTKEVSRLKNELGQVNAEKDRLLKIHNDQVKRHALTSVEDLVSLATGKEMSTAPSKSRGV